MRAQIGRLRVSGACYGERMLLGTWTGEDGTQIHLERAEGKGNTQCRVTGPRAVEIADHVAQFATSMIDGRHVRGVWQYETGWRYEAGIRGPSSGKATVVHGRLRQTRIAIERGLANYIFKLAIDTLGTPIPAIRLTAHTPSASSSA